MLWDTLQTIGYCILVTLALWTFIPERQRDGLRAGLGPAVHTIAQLLRAALIPLGRGLGAGVRWLFGVERVNHSGGAPRLVTSSDSAGKPPSNVSGSAFSEHPERRVQAFEREGTARTPDDTRTPAFSGDPLDLTDADWQVIIDSMERRGYLVLTRSEQETARKLVYRHGRQLQFEGQPAKGRAIEEATGEKRGGGKDYRRASAIYDAVIGKPDPAVSAPNLTVERQN